MTAYLFRIILDVSIKAESQEDAEAIAQALDVSDMDVETWSSEAQYKGIDEEGSE